MVWLNAMFGVLINAAPLYGTLVPGWSAITIVVLYWFESAPVALAATVRARRDAEMGGRLRRPHRATQRRRRNHEGRFRERDAKEARERAVEDEKPIDVAPA